MTLGFERGKFLIENGAIKRQSGQDALVQKIRQRLYCLKGEVENSGVGVDYTRFFGDGTNALFIDETYRRTLLEIPEVEKIVSYEGVLNKGTRTYEVRLTLKTTLGVLSLEA